MRSTLLPRLHLLVVLLAAFGWLLGISFLLTPLILRIAGGDRLTASSRIALIWMPAIALAGHIIIAARLPDLALHARLFPGRVLGILSLTGMLAILRGSSLTYQAAFQLSPPEMEITVVMFV